MFALVHEPIELESLRRAVMHPTAGAVLTFAGTVRAQTADRNVTHLEYEAYEPMALAELESLGAAVVAEFGLAALACSHRLGRLVVGDVALAVALSAPHRRAALQAMDAFIERLKQNVPIWKKEHFAGGAVWIGTPEDPQGLRTSPFPAARTSSSPIGRSVAPRRTPS